MPLMSSLLCPACKDIYYSYQKKYNLSTRIFCQKCRKRYSTYSLRRYYAHRDEINARRRENYASDPQEVLDYARRCFYRRQFWMIERDMKNVERWLDGAQKQVVWRAMIDGGLEKYKYPPKRVADLKKFYKELGTLFIIRQKQKRAKIQPQQARKEHPYPKIYYFFPSRGSPKKFGVGFFSRRSRNHRLSLREGVRKS